MYDKHTSKIDLGIFVKYFCKIPIKIREAAEEYVRFGFK
jgi:hypothetical protein